MDCIHEQRGRSPSNNRNLNYRGQNYLSRDYFNLYILGLKQIKAFRINDLGQGPRKSLIIKAFFSTINGLRGITDNIH